MGCGESKKESLLSEADFTKDGMYCLNEAHVSAAWKKHFPDCEELTADDLKGLMDSADKAGVISVYPVTVEQTNYLRSEDGQLVHFGTFKKDFEVLGFKKQKKEEKTKAAAPAAPKNITKEELAAQKADGNAPGPYVVVYSGEVTVFKEMDTDSSRVGALYSGGTVEVLEVSHQSGSVWGRSEKGWMALVWGGTKFLTPAAPASSFSITEEELAAQSLAALKARAEELGCPLSKEDAAAMGEMMKSGDSVTLPTSQAEVDEKLGQVKQMPKEAFEQMIEMAKMMAGKGNGKGQ